MFADFCDRDGDDFSSWWTFAHRCHRHTCLPLQKTNQGDTDDRDDELDDDDGIIMMVIKVMMIAMLLVDQSRRFPCCVLLALSTNENPSTDKLSRAIN